MDPSPIRLIPYFTIDRSGLVSLLVIKVFYAFRGGVNTGIKKQVKEEFHGNLK
jgi:hypothetical protein